ncbi:MAG: hypothetical protein ABIK89_00660, partial [Planctomycetota bacterium]
ADLVKLDGISAEVKVDVLVRHVTAHGELPPGCEYLWSEPTGGWRLSGAKPQGVSTWGTASLCPSHPVPPGPLLSEVLARLEECTLETFYARVAGQHSDAFLMTLLAAWKQEESTRAGLARIVRAMDAPALVSLFLAHGPAFFQEYPEDEPSLGAKLHEIVGSLIGNVGQFSERLDVALAGRHLLLDEDLNMATGWANVRRALLDMSQLQQERSGILRKRPLRELENACRRMAEAALKAMPRKRFDDDREGNRKQEHLRQLGRRLSGGRPLLPLGIWQYDALWQKVTWYFQNGTWPEASLAQMCRRPWLLKPSWRLVGAVVAVVLVVAAILAFRSFDADKPGRGGEISDRPGPVASQTPPGSNASARRAQARREEPGAVRGTTDRAAAERPEERPATEQADDPGKEWKEGEPETREAEAEASQQPAERPVPQVAEMQAPASQPIREPATESARSPEEIWKAQAERVARAHAGKFLDEEPLAEGELRISADALPVSTGSGALFLGGGVLHFDHAFYPFGVGFDAEPPVSRHEVPELASALGFPSVYVELQARASGSAVVLGLVPNPEPPDAEDRKKELLEQVEKNARQIIAQLRTHQSRTATQEAKDEAFENLVKLTAVEIPPVPPKPDRRDDQFRENPEAYRTALTAYSEAVAVHNRAVDSVVPTAKQAVASVDAKKEYIENEIRKYEEELRAHNKAGLATLREQCRRISVILYRAVAGKAASGRSAAERGPAAGALPSVQARFRVEDRPAPGLHPPAIARIKPVVTGAGGRALPTWFREELVT